MSGGAAGINESGLKIILAGHFVDSFVAARHFLTDTGGRVDFYGKAAPIRDGVAVEQFPRDGREGWKMNDNMRQNPLHIPVAGSLAGSAPFARELDELRREVEQMRLELTALKNFMKVANSSFSEQFPLLLEKAQCDDGDSN